MQEANIVGICDCERISKTFETSVFECVFVKLIITN